MGIRISPPSVNIPAPALQGNAPNSIPATLGPLPAQPNGQAPAPGLPGGSTPQQATQQIPAQAQFAVRAFDGGS